MSITVSQFSSQYSQYLSNEQSTLLQAAAAYYQFHIEQLVKSDSGFVRGDFNDFGEFSPNSNGSFYLHDSTGVRLAAEVQLNLVENSSNGGGVSFGEIVGSASLFLPTLGQSGNNRIPVAGISGYDSSTFMTYDTVSAIPHETGHIILGLLGMGTGVAQELPNAVLASVGRDAIAAANEKASLGSTNYYLDIANYLRSYFGLNQYDYASPAYEPIVNHGDMLARARLPDSSYENLFNIANNSYQKAGLSNAPSDYRVKGDATL